MTLTEFLLPRIAEDKAWLSPLTARRMIGRKMVDVPIERLPDYVVRDRKRWAAECEAKRRIVEECVEADEEGTSGGVVARRVLRLLALPYADHPDYRQEWRPRPARLT